MSQAESLVAAIERAAVDAPDRGIGIYDGRARNCERCTYPEIWQRLQTAAARWVGRGVVPGDRVLVSLPTGWEWMEAWLGALVAGAYPAALAPPGALGTNEGYLHRLEGVAGRIEPAAIVVPSNLADEVRERLGAPWDRRVCDPSALSATAPATGFRPARPAPEDLAFMQFTSGSTGLPRAVQMPHRAVLHNNAACDLAIGAPHGGPASAWADGMVSWLPLHHDMGLVGCLFLSFNLKLDLWLLNPTAFLARPKLWLERLAAHGQVFAPAPNFGYQLCVERLRPEDLEGVDLSGWRSAMSGAEMVREETFEGFAALTEAAGFRREGVVPCYGLAEAALAVAFDQRGRGVRTRPAPGGVDAGLGLDAVVSVGEPVPETRVHIVGPDGRTLPDGAVGEVRVEGPGLFTGYWGDPEATAEGLIDGQLATGDLGFVHDGELYLTGRSKDVLILRGHNVMPHELEWQAEAVAGGGGSLRCGAFSVARDAQGEQAVLVMETTVKDVDRLAAMEREIRNRIGRDGGIVLGDFLFVRRGKIPKTTSGKVQRRQLRDLYLEGRLERLNVGGETIHG